MLMQLRSKRRRILAVLWYWVAGIPGLVLTFAVIFLLGLLMVACTGCTAPQDGMVGINYCGETVSVTACPCDRKLDCTSNGCLCLAPDIARIDVERVGLGEAAERGWIPAEGDTP